MDNLFENVYKNKKVLVTGHTGFKGTWLSLWLKMMGADVIGYSLEPPFNPNMFEAIDLASGIKSIHGDIRDSESLEKVFEEHQPEIVFHLAAQSLVHRSYSEPKYTYETNVIGTLNVLEAVKKTPSVRVVVNVTSDKCYENKEWVFGYRENDPMGGYDPYSSSKGCAEILAASYRNSFFNPKDYDKHNVALASARAGNVIGGGDWSENRLVPDIIRALATDKPIVIRSPNSVRPWQSVLEPLSGYLLLASCMYDDGTKYSESWNFGPEYSEILPVEDIVKTMIDKWGNGKYIVENDSNLHEARLLKLDISKAISDLDWKPVYNIDETISELVEWYKEFYSNKFNLENFSEQQIQNYVDKAKDKNLDWCKI